MRMVPRKGRKEGTVFHKVSLISEEACASMPGLVVSWEWWRSTTRWNARIKMG
jgi:hypothetical protein